MPRPSTVLLLTAALALGACGGDDDDTTTEPAASEAATTDDAAVPERIVSLSPTTTENLFAIGAGDLVVAADDRSNYPEEAPDTELSGYEPNVEAIAGYEPDLVIMDSDAIGEELDRLGIDLLVQPAATNLDDAYAQITELGELTGHENEAATVIADTKDRIAQLTESVPQDSEPLTYYYELDSTYFSVTSSTFIGDVLSNANLTSIADAADDGSGYPQLNAEFIIDADPDLILLADTKCCGESVETVSARAGWENMQAVRASKIVELDDDIASRWGPRVVELLEQVVSAAYAVA